MGGPFPDRHPYDEKVGELLVNADYLVAMSDFGEQELLKHFPDFMVKKIPHGVDTKTFHPRSEEEIIELRKKWGIPEGKRVFLFVGANFGERKCPCQLMIIFKRFLKEHPDSILYMFTTLRGSYPSSYDLMEFAEDLGIAGNIMGPSFNLTLDPVEDEMLSELYALAYATILPSLGEGRGLPIMESMASGTPLIATNCSAIPEQVEGRGWLVDMVPEDMWVDVPVWLPLHAQYKVPDLRSLLHCMEDAYENPQKVKAYGEASREFSLNYDWSKLIPLWDDLIKEMVESV